MHEWNLWIFGPLTIFALFLYFENNSYKHKTPLYFVSFLVILSLIKNFDTYYAEYNRYKYSVNCAIGKIIANSYCVDNSIKFTLDLYFGLLNLPKRNDLIVLSSIMPLQSLLHTSTLKFSKYDPFGEIKTNDEMKFYISTINNLKSFYIITDCNNSNIINSSRNDQICYILDNLNVSYIKTDEHGWRHYIKKN
jgi:hypothetical protein